MKLKLILALALTALTALSASAKPKHYTTLYVYNLSSMDVVAFPISNGAVRSLEVPAGQIRAIPLNTPDDPVTGEGVLICDGIFYYGPPTFDWIFYRVIVGGIHWDYFEKWESCSVIVTDGEIPGTIEATPIERHNHPHVE